MKFHKSIPTLIALFVATASFASTINEIMNPNIGNQPTNIQTQTRGYYTLGGASVRYDLGGSIKPFNLEMPTIRSGCSGIDSVWGGFSYLNFEYLVQKLQRLTAAAPAFAFNMALGVLCKDCQQVAQDLEKIADQINSINMQGCQAASSWGKAAGTWLYDQANGITDSGLDSVKNSVKNDISPITSFLHNTAQSNWANDINNCVNNAACGNPANRDEAAKKLLNNAMANGSVIERSLTLINMLNSQNDSLVAQYFGASDAQSLKNIIRALIGDIYIYTNANGASSTIMPIQAKASVFSLVKFLIGDANSTGASTFPAIRLVEHPNAATGLYGKPDIIDESVALQSGSMKERLKSQINTIFVKLQTNQQISPQELAVMNAMPLPIYKMANTVGIFGNEIAANAAADYLAVQEINHLLRSLLTSSRQVITAYHANAANSASNAFIDNQYGNLNIVYSGMVKQIHDGEMQLNELDKTAAAEFERKYEFAKKMQDMEKELRQRLNNNKLYSAYLYNAGI